MNKTRDFIDLNQIAPKELHKIIELALKLKHNPKLKIPKAKSLSGKNFVLIFEKTSTRTRISFEIAINQLLGNSIFMSKNEMQLKKGETIADTARVLTRMCDGIILRVNAHQSILDFAQYADVPVINALSDFSHPCQIMASIMTIIEHLKKIEGKKLAWFGDDNNVLVSYIHAAAAFGYELRIAAPKITPQTESEIAGAKSKGAKISHYLNAQDCARSADVLITDTWISMGEASENDEELKAAKIKELMPYQVTPKLMQVANKYAIFTHCLPAYRGYEVAAEVIDSERSVVFDEAENRLHIQKAILLWTAGAV